MRTRSRPLSDQRYARRKGTRTPARGLLTEPSLSLPCGGQNSLPAPDGGRCVTSQALQGLQVPEPCPGCVSCPLHTAGGQGSSEPRAEEEDQRPSLCFLLALPRPRRSDWTLAKCKSSCFNPESPKASRGSAWGWWAAAEEEARVPQHSPQVALCPGRSQNAAWGGAFMSPPKPSLLNCSGRWSRGL